MTDFVEVKTSELTGGGLNWAVAKAEGYEPMLFPHSRNEYGVVASLGSVEEGNFTFKPCVYCTDWSQGGPLIEKYHMNFCCEHPETIGAALCDENGMYIDDRMMFGKTHLIAACRAIVASVLGDTASVPKELLS